MLKVVIELHDGETSLMKVWRFFSGREYTKDEVEAEVTSLFPHIIKKGFALSFSTMMILQEGCILRVMELLYSVLQTMKRGRNT